MTKKKAKKKKPGPKAKTGPKPGAEAKDRKAVAKQIDAATSHAPAPSIAGTAMPSNNPRYQVRLRWEAGIVYVTDPSVPTIDGLRKDPRFAHVSNATLEAWSAEDHWTQRRAEIFKKWATRIENEVGQTLAVARKREIEALGKIEALAWVQLSDVAPRSFEGVCKVIMEIYERMDRLRRDTLGAMNPVQGGDALPALPENANVPTYNQNEIAVAVKSILAMRRDQMRADLAASQAQRDGSNGTIEHGESTRLLGAAPIPEKEGP